MPAGFFTMDRELRFTYVNPAAEAMWERPADSLVGQSAIHAFPGMEDTEFARAAKGASGDPVFLEAQYPPKNKWYEVHAYPTDDGYAVYFRDVTERHRAANALREAEERYRTIVEQLPAITYVDDYVAGEGGLLYMSPQVESILGFRQDECLGDPDFWWNHAHPDDRDAVAALDEAIRNEGAPFEAEYRMIAKDGRIVWFHDRATLLVDPSGKKVVHGVMLDVTQRHTAEHELRERMKERTCALRVSNAVAADLAADELCDLTATALVEAMQYPELVGTRVRIGDTSASAGAPPGDVPERLEAAIGDPDRDRGEVSVWYTRPTGFLPEERIHVGQIADLLNGWFERREAARALRESEERFRFLAENARDVVYRYRFLPTTGTEYISPSVATITGYTPEEYYAQPELAPSTVHPDDRDLMVAAGQEPDGEPAVLRWIRKDGGVVWIEAQNTPVLDEHGRRVAMDGIARDVTARIKAEEGQRASYEALIRANEQRRQLLARLVRAQEEERQRIASDIHDDPIQVMTAVGMRLSLASRGVANAATLADLAQAEDTVRLAIERLRRLVFELHPLSLDTDGLVAALRDHCRLMAKDGGPEAEIDDRLAAEPPPESRVILYRLAQEALTNVRKHAKAISVSVSVRSEREGTAVAIRDDGIGFVVDPAHPDPGHLGVRSMIERAESAGGRCRVDSEPGRGTTVEFWIPAIAPPASG
jgi:PAS domain S-box-containing protein